MSEPSFVTSTCHSTARVHISTHVVNKPIRRTIKTVEKATVNTIHSAHCLVLLGLLFWEDSHFGVVCLVLASATVNLGALVSE
jgi:hypothetical protein